MLVISGRPRTGMRAIDPQSTLRSEKPHLLLVDPIMNKLTARVNFKMLSAVDFEDVGRLKKQINHQLDAGDHSVRLASALVSTLVDLVRPAICTPICVHDDETTEMLIRRVPDLDDFLELRMAIVGNVDSGKSTTVGVLTTNDGLDDGRGAKRKFVAAHKHEVDDRRTSCISHRILGFDERGNVVNELRNNDLDWADIGARSSKVVTFIDLCGHEKYLKTTVSGLTGHAPDHVMLVVGANQGTIGMFKEHLGLALGLGLPLCAVVTKIDMCPAPVMERNVKLLAQILKSTGCRKVPIMVDTMQDVVLAVDPDNRDRVCPIFLVSNVTGTRLDLLRAYLNLLRPARATFISGPTQLRIDDTYTVPGIGTVVSGTMRCGAIKVNDTVLLGPTKDNTFVPVGIKSIMRHRNRVSAIKGGDMATLALKKVKRSDVRAGMVLHEAIHPAPQAVWRFRASVLVLRHRSTIFEGYQSMLHIGSVRQAANIVAIDNDLKYLRVGQRDVVTFQFVKQPEFINAGDDVVFREGNARGIGAVIAPCYGEEYQRRPRNRQSRADRKALKRTPVV